MKSEKDKKMKEKLDLKRIENMLADEQSTSLEKLSQDELNKILELQKQQLSELETEYENTNPESMFKEVNRRLINDLKKDIDETNKMIEIK